MALPKDYKEFGSRLTGRLISGLDSAKLAFPGAGETVVADNYSSLKNMKYTDNGIRGVTGGMTKINSSTALAFPKIRNMFHFTKSTYEESHVLVQAFNSDETESQVFKNDTAIPNTGDFDATQIITDGPPTFSITSLIQNGLSITLTVSAEHEYRSGVEVIHTGFSDSAYNGHFRISNPTRLTYDVVATYTATDTGTVTEIRRGRFSDTPDEHLVYCNGATTKVWGGDKSKLSAFIVIDNASDVFRYDYTENVQNFSTKTSDLASLFQDSASDVYILIGNTMPISAINWQIGSAPNDTVGTLAVNHWDGTAWVAVSGLSDGTDSGGIPLAQSGSMTFTSTAGDTKQKVIEGQLGFWYQVIIPGGSVNTRIVNVSVTVPVQPLQDFWDGELRPVTSVVKFDNIAGATSRFEDNTINVLKDEYTYDKDTRGNTSTYMNVSKLGLAEYVLVGSLERLQGIQVKFVSAVTNTVNTTASTTIAVEYWNGAAWTALTVTDGTDLGGVSFGQAGFITWNPIDENVEFETNVVESTSSDEGIPLFYYKISFDKQLAAGNDYTVLVSYIAMIPVQRQIDNYDFPLYAQNRLWLFDKSSAIVSKLNTLNSFNGKDSGDPFFFGAKSKTVAAIELYDRTIQKSSSVVLVLRGSSTHIITGDNPENWAIIDVETEIGCNAPLSLAKATIGLEFAPLQRRQIAFWQGNSGIYIFDNSTVNLISDDISNYFDQTQSESINLKMADRSVIFIEVENGEHFAHWLFASGTSTTLDKELVFDIKRQNWFEVDRTSNKRLQGGGLVRDNSLNMHSYGYEDNGYLHHLNNGTDFDGNSIAYEFEFGDILPSNNLVLLTIIDTIRLIVVSKETTSSTITLTHTGDSIDSGTTHTLQTARTGYRLAMPAKRIQTDEHLFHRLKFTISTNDEAGTGFEPLYVGGLYRETKLAEYNLTD